jgi:hypothetical protein
MYEKQHRYFIELQPEGGPAPPRWQEAEIRREQAANFITVINAWLKREDLEDKVVAMEVTALGQVQIICEAGIISQIRSHGDTSIAAIRPGAAFAENLGRFG